MATVEIKTLDLSTAETRAVRWARELANAERASQVPPLSAFANNKTYIEHLIATSMIPSWIRAEAEASPDLHDIKAAWNNATDKQRLAAIAALQ